MRTRNLIIAVVALVALCSAPLRAQDDAQSLIAKHRAFVGWQLGDGTFKTLRMERDRTDARGAITERSLDRRIGLLYRITNMYPKRPNLTDELGFTGSVFWRTDMNGFTNPIYGDLAKYRLSLAVFLNEALPSAGATLLRTATEDGKDVAIVRIQVPSAFPVDMAIDTATGALVEAVIDAGGDYETTFHILSYAEPLPGKKIIGSYRTGDGPGTFTYTKIEPNVDLSSADLHPRNSTASWTFDNPKPFAISVTNTRIIVHAKVNGTDGTFILDTGAGEGIILNEPFADKVGATDLHVHDQTLTLYDPTPIELRRVEKVDFGGNTLSNIIVQSVDFNNAFANRNYRGLDGKNYDGLIGYSLFAGAIVRLDPLAQTMTIADPAVFDPSGEKGLPVLVDLSENMPAVPMTVNDAIAVKAYFDSGDPDEVIFSPDLIFKYHLTFGTKAQGAIGGIGMIACGTLNKLTLGPIVYASVDACERKTDVMGGRNILVGLDFLRHFDITFDYPHGRLYLLPVHQ